MKNNLMSMLNDRTQSRSNFLPMLTVLFIGLKLGGIIAWSWWWILAPLWISFSVLFVIGSLLVIINAIIKSMD